MGAGSTAPGRDRVVPLAGCRPPAPTPARPLPGARGPAAVHWFGLHLSPADRAALSAWSSAGGHGYDRVALERGVLEDGTATSFALIHAAGQAWSTWGAIRRDGAVEVWRCATGKTVGRFGRMADALASLPPAGKRR